MKILIFILCLSSIYASAPVILVTGASRGIGFAIAELLAENHYIVYAGVRKTSNLEQIHSAKHYEQFHPIELDVIDQESIDRAIQTIMDEQGRIDVLVNNAGALIFGSLENTTIEDAKDLFEVNFFGVMRVMQSVLPIMRAQRSGKIIQISSRSAFRPLPTLSVYAASKFALEGLSESLHPVLKKWNINISLIEPGPVATDLDVNAPFGSHLAKDQDPYYPLFNQSGLLDPFNPTPQPTIEVARIVKQAIEADTPQFRYQTTSAIELQAAERMIDIRENCYFSIWNDLLNEI